MKYLGRTVIVFLSIVTVLYGSKEVWGLPGYKSWAAQAGTWEPDPSTYRYDPKTASESERGSYAGTGLYSQDD